MKTFKQFLKESAITKHNRFKSSINFDSIDGGYDVSLHDTMSISDDQPFIELKTFSQSSDGFYVRNDEKLDEKTFNSMVNDLNKITNRFDSEIQKIMKSYGFQRKHF